MMKIAVLSLVFGLVAILIITGCSDRTRLTCKEASTAQRCNTANGATTP